MRWIFKWIFRLVFLLVVLLVLALVFKDTIARVVLEHRIRDATGMDTHIGRASIALLSPTVTIDDLKLYNTPDFGGGTLLDMPELHLEYDREALVKSQFHIKLLRLDIAEVDVVKDAAGNTNVTSLNDVKKRLARLFPRSKGSSTTVDFAGIDVLNLSFGKMRFIDLKNPDENHDVIINLKDEVVNNIRTQDDVKSALFMIWLQHGTDMGISASDLLSGFSKRHSKKPKSESTNAVNGIPAH
jgi:uncharacterized protein involved in outer membrane biogenesis